MKSNKSLIGVVVLIFLWHYSFGQKKLNPFLMPGHIDQTIELNQTFTETREIFPFTNRPYELYGLAITADITLESYEGVFRAVLIDNNRNEYLIFESYKLLEPVRKITANDLCEETYLLDGIIPRSIRIEITEGKAVLKSLSLSKSPPAGLNVRQVKREQVQSQQAEKIKKINRSITEMGLDWVAGPTGISALSYSQRKKLFGEGAFPPGFEYYSGGVIRTGKTVLKSVSESMMVDTWDWRNRHGQNWLTPVKDQGYSGTCWAFAATGATEALVNIFFNQHPDLDLSEQEILSCSGKGSCNGGLPKHALNYIINTGIVDETTFSYTSTDQPCSEKGINPSELVQIGGVIDFGFESYQRSEDVLKKMLIEYGPLSSGLYDWSHAMVLVGYHVVKEGDRFYHRNASGAKSWYEVANSDPLAGKTVWIFKNSWGSSFGDNGYVYVETDISNIGWTHALMTPVRSLVQDRAVVCKDNDGDGFYWWGLGPKPQYCNCPDEPDGDDSNPELGPIDEYGNCRKMDAFPVAGLPGSPEDTISGDSSRVTEESIVTSGTSGKGDDLPETVTSVFKSDRRSDVLIFPNPVMDKLYLQIADNAVGNYYFIHNTPGQLIDSDKINESLSQIDISGYVPGIYYISVVIDRNIWNEKFIKR